jgi:hypothetical protein
VQAGREGSWPAYWVAKVRSRRELSGSGEAAKREKEKV